MAKSVIKVENVSKVYRLGEIGTGSLGSDINRWWVTKVLGGEDPYLRIGQTNDRATKGDSDVVYSLRNVSFEVQQGEVLGIIGKNGAGKSTLLKILSRITAPTTGKVKIKGRVASLLEVGTGFHPELTGRENIFLNGSILGMRKHEIVNKLDEIIDFSGVERYIDTPVKRYSSGMYVRLAFAVAAHLESEILIVDEVLAVGDAEFQKKCLGRMKDVSSNEGRTVLFVSHNMASLINICSKGFLLQDGFSKDLGPINHVVSNYLGGMHDSSSIYVCQEIFENKIFQIESASVSYNSYEINIKINFIASDSLRNVVLGFILCDSFGYSICGYNNKFMGTNLFAIYPPKGSFEITTEKIKLHSGEYYISLFIGDFESDFEQMHNVLRFSVVNTEVEYSKAPPVNVIGPIFINVKKITFS
jgi:lipopolysaccharide transport system ATP-binding protein